MSYKESDIAYENGPVWVLNDSRFARYVVFVSGVTHSTSDSVFELTEDGFSLAKARADYLAKRKDLQNA